MSKLTLTDINTLMGEYVDVFALPTEAVERWEQYREAAAQVDALPLSVNLLESEEWQSLAEALEAWRAYCYVHQAELLAAFERAQSMPAGDVW